MKIIEELALEVAQEHCDEGIAQEKVEMLLRFLAKIQEQGEPIYEVWNRNDYPSHWEEVDKYDYDREKCEDDKRIIYLRPPKTNTEGLEALGEKVESQQSYITRLKTECMELEEELKAARRTAEYWKANHLAGNALIDRYRAVMEMALEALEQCYVIPNSKMSPLNRDKTLKALREALNETTENVNS